MLTEKIRIKKNIQVISSLDMTLWCRYDSL